MATVSFVGCLLIELKEAIKKAAARREILFDNNDRAWEKVQDEINKLREEELLIMQQLGESQLPAPLPSHAEG